jgi:tetratricopeptide (TPR) repeat protein
VTKDKKIAENWVVWGLILRTAGKFQSAKHKFEKALRLDPNNLAAQHELELVDSLIYFDKTLPTDATLKIDQTL